MKEKYIYYSIVHANNEWQHNKLKFLFSLAILETLSNAKTMWYFVCIF